MIIASLINDQIHISALLKDKAIGEPVTAGKFGDVVIDDIISHVTAIRSKYKSRLLSPGASSIFVSERGASFYQFKDPMLTDVKTEEYVKWNISQNCNIDEIEYAYSRNGGNIFVQSVKKDFYAFVYNFFKKAFHDIECFDTHLFNEISYIKKITGEEFNIYLKLSQDYVGLVAFDEAGGFKYAEFDFAGIRLMMGKSALQYGAEEIMLVHELIKKIVRWLSLNPVKEPGKLFLLNTTEMQLPYYMQLRIQEEITDNFNYVNHMAPFCRENIFDYIDFNLKSVASRWRG